MKWNEAETEKVLPMTAHTFYSVTVQQDLIELIAMQYIKVITLTN